MTNAVTAKDMKQKNMKKMVTAMMPEIEKALPTVITAERFTRMVFTALSSNPKLAECTPNSFLGAMMQAAQLGLEPNTPLGQAYLIPYKNHGTQEAQFQIGYKGLIDLAHRSGEFKSIEAHEVYEGDTFEFEYGFEPKLIHRPAMHGRGNVYCYYAVYTLTNGGRGFEVMSKEDVEGHKKRFSKAAGSSFSPWKDNFDEMAKKTVIKKVLKYAPIKADFARDMSADCTIKTDLSDNMSAVPDETVYETTAEVINKTAEQSSGNQDDFDEAAVQDDQIMI